MSYEVLRMATGDVTAYALVNTPAYVIADWTRQTDMTSSDRWLVLMPERGMLAPFVGGLERGGGILYGNYAGVFEFFTFTELQQQYVNLNILNSKPIEIVTALAYDDFSRELAVFTGELVSPHAANAETTYAPNGHGLFSNNQYAFRAATKKQISVLGSETTANLLTTELGYVIGLETQS